MKDREPKNAVAVRLDTYEAMNNVLLEKVVVDCLRHWAWRTKRKLRRRASHNVESKQQIREDSMDRSLGGRRNFTFQKQPKLPVRHDGAWHQLFPIRECKDFKDATLPVKQDPVDDSDRYILRAWSAKKAGKRPFHLNEIYHEDQQLSLPLLRTRMYGPRNPWKMAEIYGGGSSKDSVDNDLEMLDEAVGYADSACGAAIGGHLSAYEDTSQMDVGEIPKLPHSF